MIKDIHNMTGYEIQSQFGHYPDDTEEGKIWYSAVHNLYAVNLGVIRDNYGAGPAGSAVGSGKKSKPAKRSVAKDKKGWAVLEGSDEKVRLAGPMRQDLVAIANFKITTPLPWIQSLKTPDFTLAGICVEVKAFNAVFMEYCRCKNIDQIVSIRRASWFFDRFARPSECRFNYYENRCNANLHWAELRDFTSYLQVISVEELIAMTSVPPTVNEFKKFLAETEKIFKKYPKNWNALPDEIQRAHVTYCQQLAVACPFLAASLGQEKPFLRFPRRIYAVLYRAAIGVGVYPPGTTAKTLASMKRLHNNYCLMHYAAMSGHLPPGTTVADMMSSQHEGPFKAPIYYAAQNGHLDKIPGVTAEHLRAVGALTMARQQILEFYRDTKTVDAVVNNIVGCPDLGDALKIEANTHKGRLAQTLLEEVLKHPGCTPEKRTQLAKNKNLIAALL